MNPFRPRTARLGAALMAITLLLLSATACERPETADEPASETTGETGPEAGDEAAGDGEEPIEGDSREADGAGMAAEVPPLPTMRPEERETVPQLYLTGEEQPGEPEWVAERTVSQAAAVEASGVRADWRLSDGLPATGIAWSNHASPDSGKDFKPNHYDHGNGVAAADVDGDGLVDLYFTSQVGPNGLFRSTGGGAFEEITDSAGVAVADAVSIAAAFADIDNDGDPDLYVTTVKEGNRLFLNEGGGAFTDISDSSGTGLVAHSSGADFFDYDKDGLVDLYVSAVGVYTGRRKEPAPIDPTNLDDPMEYEYWVGLSDAFAGHVYDDRTEVSRLYRNLGEGRFEDVTEAMGLGEDPSWTGDAVPFDANGDGWTDLYVLDMQGNDEYYENQQGARFERRSREVFPYTPWGAMGGVAFDWDNDGDQDLFVTDMHSDMMEDIAPQHDKAKMRQMWPESTLRTRGISLFGNAFFQGGDEGFEDVSDATGAEMYWPWGLSTGDLNADGFEDVLISAGMGFFFRYGPNSLLLNQGGERLVDAEFVMGLEPRQDGSYFRPWFVVDCDGADAGNSHCEGRKGVVQFWEAHSSRGTLMLDLEGDGDLDVVLNEWSAPPQVLTSDLAALGGLRHLTVELEGTTSNRDALGAVVRVTAGDLVQTQLNDGQSGYLAQSDLPLYFGLGEAEAADRIEVTWPTGETQVLEGPIEAGAAVEIVEE